MFILTLQTQNQRLSERLPKERHGRPRRANRQCSPVKVTGFHKFLPIQKDQPGHGIPGEVLQPE